MAINEKTLVAQIFSIMGTLIKSSSYLTLIFRAFKYFYKFTKFIISIFSGSFISAIIFWDLGTVIEVIVNYKDNIVLKMMHWLSLLLSRPEFNDNDTDEFFIPSFYEAEAKISDNSNNYKTYITYGIIAIGTIIACGVCYKYSSEITSFLNNLYGNIFEVIKDTAQAATDNSSNQGASSSVDTGKTTINSPTPKPEGYTDYFQKGKSPELPKSPLLDGDSTPKPPKSMNLPDAFPGLNIDSVWGEKKNNY